MQVYSRLGTITGFSVAALALNATAQTTHHVDVNSLTFDPATITVAPGDLVVWTLVAGNHTVTSGAGCVSDGLYFDEALNDSNSEYTWVVPSGTASEVPYFCAPHCLAFGMEGMIFVNTPDLANSHATTIDGENMLQISGATEGAVQGGDATSDQRTVYIWGNDNDETPGYNGSAWPLVTADDIGTVGAGVDVNIFVNASGHVIVDTCSGPRPVYQFRNDNSAATANGQGLGGVWWAIDAETGEILDGVTSCAPVCPGDLNGDLVVDIVDFSEFLIQFGTSGTGLSADLDGDLDVDINDFSEFLVNFGNDCNGRSESSQANLGRNKDRPVTHRGTVGR